MSCCYPFSQGKSCFIAEFKTPSVCCDYTYSIKNAYLELVGPFLQKKGIMPAKHTDYYDCNNQFQYLS